MSGGNGKSPDLPKGPAANGNSPAGGKAPSIPIPGANGAGVLPVPLPLPADKANGKGG